MRDAVDRTFDLPQQAGQRRVGLGLAAEERHLDAIGEVLVDQDRDVLAVAQRFRHPERRVAAGRDQRSHFHRANFFDDPVGGGAVGPAKQDGGVESVRHRCHGGKLPIAEVARKDQRRLAVEPQLREQFVGARRNFDPALLGEGGIVLPDMIEMGKFGAEPAEIVPDACENGLDFLSAIFPGMRPSDWRGRSAARASLVRSGG